MIIQITEWENGSHAHCGNIQHIATCILQLSPTMNKQMLLKIMYFTVCISKKMTAVVHVYTKCRVQIWQLWKL